jgi:hypothetical protein
MQAIMQPRTVKVPSPVASSKVVQPKATERTATEKKPGRRFLEFLMIALAAPAV